MSTTVTSPSSSSYFIPNTGSTARDYCMLERNLLSHLKLALLLSILSASIILRARLVPVADYDNEDGGVPLASVEFAAAVVCIVAGGWEYYQGYWDLKSGRAFLVAPKYVCRLSSVGCSLTGFGLGAGCI
jgi:hypothetical protein